MKASLLFLSLFSIFTSTTANAATYDCGLAKAPLSQPRYETVFEIRSRI